MKCIMAPVLDVKDQQQSPWHLLQDDILLFYSSVSI